MKRYLVLTVKTDHFFKDLDRVLRFHNFFRFPTNILKALTEYLLVTPSLRIVLLRTHPLL